MARRYFGFKLPEATAKLIADSTVEIYLYRPARVAPKERWLKMSDKESKEEPQGALSPETLTIVQLIADLQTKLDARFTTIESRIAKYEAKEKDPKAGEEQMTRADHPEPGGAWLIKTPLETYSGNTAKVNFTNGVGIVHADSEGAARTVHMLEFDFGYAVTPLTPEQTEAFLREQSKKNAEKPKEDSKVKKKSGALAEKLGRPEQYGFHS